VEGGDTPTEIQQWQEAAAAEAGPSRLQAVHPQRGREDAGSQREIRRENYPELRALQGAHPQLQPRHHLQG
uniref:Uncharacterized protein n=1 Tax=Pundamilia nyererei TaxID=303518 RepID=A0A3B4EYV6_9CICH